ncbi:hemerythrin domain-containing protein [bacterium]|jgi:hypothetical protein|nr:hemerythrin domain-containing protein [bacterium]
MDDLPEPLAGLVREHRLVEQIVHDAREAIDAATVRDASDEVVTHAMDILRDLDAFLAIDLTTHIAKEEEVLFPVMRKLIEENEAIVVDMLAQHDEVRAKEWDIQRMLAALDATHDEVHAESASLQAGLAVAGARPSLDVMVGFRDTVMKLDWILQGHFGDEEDALFEPAPGWFTAEQFAEFARQMDEVERSMS